MIIETLEEYSTFLDLYSRNKVILVPLLTSDRKHTANNGLLALFVKIIDTNQWFILPFSHNDCVNLDLSKLNDLNTDTKKYVFDKKAFLHIFNFKNLIDINLLYYMKFNTVINIDCKFANDPLYQFIQNKSISLKNCNKAYPIVKYAEHLIDYSAELEKIIIDNEQCENEYAFKFLNDDTIQSLYAIEKNGLYTDRTLITSTFENSKLNLNSNDIIFTEYNIYTATGRPANRHGNINFAALKNESSERACFKSRHGENGCLVMFDYDAYHFNLMSEIIGYKFESNVNIHEYLAKFYLNKETFTQEEYEQCKAINFNILYGGIDDTVANTIPFFGEVKKFIDTTWQNAQSIGYTETQLFKKKIYINNFNSLNCNKLFNYILQNYETERNVVILQKIQDTIKDFKTKIVLYLYDGFLFDVHNEELQSILDLKSVFEDNGKYKIKLYKGTDFNNMIKI